MTRESQSTLTGAASQDQDRSAWATLVDDSRRGVVGVDDMTPAGMLDVAVPSAEGWTITYGWNGGRWTAKVHEETAINPNEDATVALERRLQDRRSAELAETAATSSASSITSEDGQTFVTDPLATSTQGLSATGRATKGSSAISLV